MHPVEAYIDGVLSGSVPACRFVRLAVERHVRDLKTGHERGLWFDREAAEHSINFFQFLRHSKGEWAGQVLEPSPWQQFINWCVFGWMRKDGTRRFREVYEEVARKNGKTTKLAGIGLYLLDADGEPGAEVYAAATKRDQARIAHSEATRMVRRSKLLQKRIKTHRDNLHIEDTASKFEPLGADADTLDGLNIHGALIDELHAHKTRALVDILDTATGSRRQPLLWYITTAGVDRESVCWEKRERARQVLMGIIQDDSFFGIIFTLDTKADWPELMTVEEGKKAGDGANVEDQWDNEAVWIKANPNLGVSNKLDDLQRKARKAADTPAALNSFLRLHLSIWTSTVTRWMPMGPWDACGMKFDLESLKGQPCYGGLDLSSSLDLTSLVLIFPFEKTFRALPFFWIPEDNMRERQKRDKVPYDVWVRQGLIKATPGNVIDYDYIHEDLKKARELYDLREVAYDRWGAAKLATDLTNDGFNVIPFGQGFGSMSGPTKELMTLVLQNRFHHGGHPVLRWNADNVVVQKDAAENLKPNKAKSTARIDGVVASIMGLDRAIRNSGSGGSVYETRGLVTI